MGVAELVDVVALRDDAAEVRRLGRDRVADELAVEECRILVGRIGRRLQDRFLAPRGTDGRPDRSCPAVEELAVRGDLTVLQGVVLFGGLLWTTDVGGGLRRDVGPAAEQVDRHAVLEALVVRRVEGRRGHTTDRVAARVGRDRGGRRGVGIHCIRREQQPVDAGSVVVDVILATGAVIEVSVQLPIAEQIGLGPDRALVGDVLGDLPRFPERVARYVVQVDAVIEVLRGKIVLAGVDRAISRAEAVRRRQRAGGVRESGCERSLDLRADARGEERILHADGQLPNGQQSGRLPPDVGGVIGVHALRVHLHLVVHVEGRVQERVLAFVRGQHLVHRVHAIGLVGRRQTIARVSH